MRFTFAAQARAKIYCRREKRRTAAWRLQKTRIAKNRKMSKTGGSASSPSPRTAEESAGLFTCQSTRALARRHTLPPKTEARYRWAIFTRPQSRWPAYTASATVEREEFARGCSCLFLVSTRTGTRAHAARGDTRAPRVVRPVSAIFGFGNSPVNYRDAEIRGRGKR